MKILRYIYKVVRNILPWRIEYFIFVSRERNRIPRIFHPRDYTDFIFRDNFYGNHNKHAYLADKYEVRKYVKERGLEHILTKLYGVWDDANKIDFDVLPKGFALKCNHTCGTNIICQDKDALDKVWAVNQLNKWMSAKHDIRFEQHYQHIKPLVICEELIPLETDGSFPIDYKIHCANGKPVFIQCCFERTESNVGYRVIFDTEWNNLHYVKDDYHYSDIIVKKPKHLNEMLKYASVLSKGLDYSRIDFYDTENRVIFGEVTLTPMGGLLTYFTQEALDYMGEEIRKNKRDGKYKQGNSN